MTEADDDEGSYIVYVPSLADRVAVIIGTAAGWLAFIAAKAGCFGWSMRLADVAIILHRHGRGAIKAIAVEARRNGRPAFRRGKVMVSGQVGELGPFAGLGFFATYHVAASDEARALSLISRFEKDALPGSILIESAELYHPDDGAERVIWIAGGRTFFEHDDTPEPPWRAP